MARWLSVVLGLVVWLPLPLVATLAFAAEGEPTIGFTATGTPPLRCGSQPSVGSLSVSTGTRIIVANLTGVAAAVDVGWTKVLQLAPGKEALVELTPGQHDLRMVPNCVLVTEIGVAVVTVLIGQPPDEPSPSGEPDSPADDPITMSMAPSPTGTAGPALGGSGVAEPGAEGTTTITGPGVDPAAADGSLETGVIHVQAIDLGGSRDPKGVRLLAVIAAICVFGVTAAIIRAIVSQRTSDTVTM